MSNVPDWVYLIFLALLFIGVRNCFKRVIKTNKLILLPVGFVWLSIANLYNASSVSSYQIIFFVCGGMAGIYLGYLHARKTVLRADKHQGLVELPGDWTVLVLAAIIFAVQFGIHYLLEVDPDLEKNHLIMGMLMMVSGGTTGIVVGRNLTYFYKFMKAPHEHLHLKSKD